jgi:hypothetical protein
MLHSGSGSPDLAHFELQASFPVTMVGASRADKRYRSLGLLRFISMIWGNVAYYLVIDWREE